jgi:hypothetical protein
MKRNVDLTVNGDFQKKFSIGEINKLFSKNFMNYPWSIDKEELNFDKEIIYTGTKLDRRTKGKWDKFENGLQCECCGIDLSNKPWLIKFGLCFECNNRMERDMKNENELIKTS